MIGSKIYATVSNLCLYTDKELEIWNIWSD